MPDREVTGMVAQNARGGQAYPCMLHKCCGEPMGGYFCLKILSIKFQHLRAKYFTRYNYFCKKFFIKDYGINLQMM